MDDPLERFAGAYDLYYRNVLRYALQHAEQGTAEDVASETFLIAWRRFPTIPEPPLPWLLGVARNLLRKQAGASLRRRALASRIAMLTTQADGLAVDAGDFVVERAAALDALTSLSARDVEALTLVTWHGLSPAQAAEVVGCSARAFTVRLSRARQRLTNRLRSADPRLPARLRCHTGRLRSARPAHRSRGNRHEQAQRPAAGRIRSRAGHAGQPGRRRLPEKSA